jgi:hypothetical protein
VPPCRKKHNGSKRSSNAVYERMRLRSPLLHRLSIRYV